MSAGWLSDTPPAETQIGTFTIDRAKFPTRHAEYSFALRTLPATPGTVLDAGAGFNPEIHILPEALGQLGWTVIAVDANPEGLKMPHAGTVTRWVDDIRHLWRWQGSAFDAWLSISTIEHLPYEEERLRMMDAAFGVLRPGGTAVLTADLIPPARLHAYLRYAGFEVGTLELAPTSLRPPVSWAIGRKP